MCRWAVEPSGYSPAAVGSKAINLQELAEQLPDCIPTPASFALPFSALPRALAAAGTSYDGLAELAGDAWNGGGAHGAMHSIESVRCSHAACRSWLRVAFPAG